MHPDKSVWFLTEYSESSRVYRDWLSHLYLCAQSHMHTGTCVCWAPKKQPAHIYLMSHMIPLPCLSLQYPARQQAAGSACESQPQYAEQPEPLTEYTIQRRCQWRWLWSTLKCCSSANFHLQIRHFARPPAFFPGYALLLLQLDSFNYGFLCLLYPFNHLVSHLSY